MLTFPQESREMMGLLQVSIKWKDVRVTAQLQPKLTLKFLRSCSLKGNLALLGIAICRGMDLFGFKNEPPRWKKTKKLLHFAIETHYLRKNVSIVQNQRHKRMDMAYRKPCSSLLFCPLKLTQPKILWILPLPCLSRTDSQQIISRDNTTLIRRFCEKKNYFSKLTAGFMYLQITVQTPRRWLS